ncbi:hypothetical protein AB0J63_43520 [Streptosporangium canum]|uniref:hypothetical protein n=1 Tax=Streptosporangium canum TaxID=324952 RepID=UPI00342BF7F8
MLPRPPARPGPIRCPGRRPRDRPGVVVDGATVLGNVNPTLVPRERPVRDRRERSA